jgi:hypothetical protein
MFVIPKFDHNQYMPEAVESCVYSLSEKRLVVSEMMR